MLHLWPIALTFVGEGYVSIRRIQSFLLLPEGKYQRAQTMSHNDNEEDEEVQNLMGNGCSNGKTMNGNVGNSNGSYGTVNGRTEKKKEKNQLFKELQLTQKALYKRRIVNSNAKKKGIIFDNVTAMWISDDNGQNIGERILLMLPPLDISFFFLLFTLNLSI